MREKIVAYLLTTSANRTAEQTASLIVDTLNAADIIIQRKQIHEDAEEEERKRIKKAQDALIRQRLQLQTDCGHWAKTYFPDPSGNNDGFHRCDLCGKEF